MIILVTVPVVRGLGSALSQPLGPVRRTVPNTAAQKRSR